jgi:hypothetical protein
MNEDHTLLADLAIELWKALRSHERTLEYVPVAQVAKLEAQIRFSGNRLESVCQQAGFSLISFSGQYAPNLPATALNGDEFSGTNEPLIIGRTVEPAIVQRQDMRVMRMGKILLARGLPNVSRD